MRLKLSVTWVLINNNSSDIPILLLNLYLQYPITVILEFSPLCCTVECCTTKKHNKEKYISTYNIPPSLYLAIQAAPSMTAGCAHDDF